ncbi:putative acetyltransferase [Microbacterium resistens]|uniref:Acetyltransferase n=1 Tax=Microbacterium resistens TaxID=156977 RepID=A0ABU1S9T3_9MICO|nr:GNAT family N-acetyltransferase [Microbacterium resistens]MDR6866380.1 putative acetyltransferase [Microbacterium resistens]
MTIPDARGIAVDPRSEQRLREAGFSYRVVDFADDEAATSYLRAITRGFLDPEQEPEGIDQARAAMSPRRNVGVFEEGAAEGALPVATVNSWIAPMTVPGGEVPMWAISAVTVSGTHRRRGIARNLLEGELRAAASAGVPIAGLTVSEATIYGRYGFAPAVPGAAVKVTDPRKAGWAAPASAGRLEYVEKAELALALAEVHDRARTHRAGQIPGWAGRWERMAGLAVGDAQAASVRGVRYLDESGVVRGALAYTLAELPGSFGAEMAIRHLGAETDEALRALWGFAVNHDLVSTITVDLRPVDEPLPWLVVDQRAVEVTVHDHGWLRILDVPAALTARRYRAPLDVVLRVEDPLGLAAGTWRLRVDGSGAATVESSDAAPDAVAAVSTLSALYVGGVRATQLRASALLEASEEVAAALDDAFRGERAPHLGIWY